MLKIKRKSAIDKIPLFKNLKFKIELYSIKINSLLHKGGLKLKLISTAIIIITITVVIINSITINLMTTSIEKKAFEVSTTTIERIGDFSSLVLLERSYENKINLNEMIKNIRLSKIDGLLDISIYKSEKSKDGIIFKYLSGFDLHKIGDVLADKELVKKLNKDKRKDLFYDSQSFKIKDKYTDSYRFVKPIIYTFKNQIIPLGVIVLHYDKKAITGIISKVINVALMITMLILSITIVFIYFASSHFTQPILSIAEAATDVSEGNLDINLNINTNDEIQELANRFNIMAKGLREREKMQKFVSGSTMDMIYEDSRNKLVLGGEYNTLTFLFSDIRGFTAMSENKTPADVVGIINFYLNLQSEIIKKNHGDIDKFVGDEIMATFSGENATKNAIQSAVDIQTAIYQENVKRKLLNKTVCEVGIGINRGEVIVGNIGSHEHMDFTSIGSEVNLAARLCSSAEAGEILIVEVTYDEANVNFNTIVKEPIRFKGISTPISLYSINIKGD